MCGGCGANNPPTISPELLILSSVSIDLHAYVLRLGEEVERLEAAFAADAALLHPAERDAEVAEEPAVDPDGAAVDGCGDAVCAGEVAGPDARREAVARRVRERDRLGLISERRDRHDGAEDLLLQDATLRPEA